MAQQSARRGWDNQGSPQCFEHAWVIWTRSANSHTGRRLSLPAASKAGQMTASDHAPQRPQRFPLPGGGRPQMESRHSVRIRSAPKRCSRQAEFRHIVSRRSPCGLAGEMSEARVERRLAAILAVDVAGYSRLMGEDEEGTLAALR